MLILGVMFIAAVFGIDTRSTLSFQIFAIALVLILTAMTYALFYRRRFSVARALPEYGTVGQPLYYTCHINNLNNRDCKQLLIIDDLKTAFPDMNTLRQYRDPLDRKRNFVDRFLGYPRLVNALRKARGASIAPVVVDHISRHADIDAEIKLTPLRRGYLDFDKIRIASADPLGLFHAQKSYSQKNRLLILPELYDTPALDLPGSRIYQSGGTNRASLTGDSQEFVSLREYRPGDPMRSIHWRSYAKRGEPIVKEYQDEYVIRYGMILDTYLTEGSNNDTFEKAVSMSASFMLNQTQQDALLDLMFIGNEAYRYTSGRGHSNVDSILEILACIQSTEESNLERLRVLLDEHINECCALICILLSADKEKVELLRMLNEYRLPVKALVLHENTNRFDANDLDHVQTVHLDPTNLQAELNKLQSGQQAED